MITDTASQELIGKDVIVSIDEDNFYLHWYGISNKKVQLTTSVSSSINTTNVNNNAADASNTLNSVFNNNILINQSSKNEDISENSDDSDSESEKASENLEIVDTTSLQNFRSLQHHPSLHKKISKTFSSALKNSQISENTVSIAQSNLQKSPATARHLHFTTPQQLKSTKARTVDFVKVIYVNITNKNSSTPSLQIEYGNEITSIHKLVFKTCSKQVALNWFNRIRSVIVSPATNNISPLLALKKVWLKLHHAKIFSTELNSGGKLKGKDTGWFAKMKYFQTKN